ncbi:hypothetical protein FACS189473_1050 [Spirochaetia bacterium]|nr:hypothetical protein FACS189473_1050 [Spirochaetia bacterium]
MQYSLDIQKNTRLPGVPVPRGAGIEPWVRGIIKLMGIEGIQKERQENDSDRAKAQSVVIPFILFHLSHHYNVSGSSEYIPSP